MGYPKTIRVDQEAVGDVHAGRRPTGAGELRGLGQVRAPRVSGGALRRLTEGQGNNTSPTYSPDGRLIAFSSSRGGLFLMNQDGLNQTRILAGGGEGFSLERVAINVDDAPIADNAGAQPVDAPVVAGGPLGHFEFGSTVILACNAACGRIEELTVGAKVQVGQRLGPLG